MSAAENLRLKVLLSWAVEFVERETATLEDSFKVGGKLTIDDDIDGYVAVHIADARRWLTEARQALQ
jgi:hypothetical protein